jgi:hypothetical protein
VDLCGLRGPELTMVEHLVLDRWHVADGTLETPMVGASRRPALVPAVVVVDGSRSSWRANSAILSLVAALTTTGFDDSLRPPPRISPVSRNTRMMCRFLGAWLRRPAPGRSVPKPQMHPPRSALCTYRVQSRATFASSGAAA